MNKLIAAFATSMLLASCAEKSAPIISHANEPNVEFEENYPDATWRVSDGWQPNEVASYKSFREGSSPSAKQYTISPDGTGTLGAWTYNCAADKMTDKRSCYFVLWPGALSIGLSEKGEPKSVCVVGHDFPGKVGAIRIDDHRAVNTNEHGCVPAKTLLPHLLRGRKVTTRAIEWPYEGNVDKEADLDGIREAYALTLFVFKNISRLNFDRPPPEAKD